jgi:DNA-binding HxlR family transcriptional regulator
MQPTWRRSSIPKPTRRSDCPISFALDLFGDRWTLLVIRDLAFKGKNSFSDFLASDERIARNVLADRLASLEAEGFIEKHPHPKDLRRSFYTLTERGLGLIPVLVEMILWSAREDPDTGAEADFVREATEDREALISRLQQGPQVTER